MQYMELIVILEKQPEGGYTVYVPSLKGCISQGDTRDEALANIKEAIELYLEPDTNELIEFSGEQVKLAV
jgi:predicted RNase H-like HicB family nuclease